ncbi:hypothetical protein BKA69DRAFT_553376 [Paraphysoderma sedebokerense]|nr:hypothetical protein BKA69DRAFT_553376 [Paraphysoderma sedebokerense]
MSDQTPSSTFLSGLKNILKSTVHHVQTLPFGTLTYLSLCLLIYFLSFIKSLEVEGAFCLSTMKLSQSFGHIFKVLTSPLVHFSFGHLFFNSLTMVMLLPQLESKQGTTQFLYLIFILFPIFSGFLLFALNEGLLRLIMTTGGCVGGASGILFAILTANTMEVGGSRVIYGAFSVHAAIYPWVLLVVIQILIPSASFGGHLSGILVGYLYYYKTLNFLLIRPRFLERLETMLPLRLLARIPSYKVYDELGASSYEPLTGPISV